MISGRERIAPDRPGDGSPARWKKFAVRWNESTSRWNPSTVRRNDSKCRE
jgi:hypothetical protein